MKNTKRKIAITLFLVLSITGTMFAFPIINAQTITTYGSHIYVSLSPHTIGLGQYTNIVIWTAEMPPDIGEQSGAVASPTGRAGWTGITVTVTKPDNTTETLTMSYTDAIGSTYHLYTPTELGTYYFQANFPEQWKNTTTSKLYYSSAISAMSKLTVQTELIQEYTETPLPNDYWTRPISSINRFLYQLTGNWLGGAATQWPLAAAGGTTVKYGYSPGPESAHVLWTKSLWEGGIMDYRTQEIGYATFHYQGLAFSPLIINGKIYYAEQNTGHSRSGWNCVDLYTGETLFFEGNLSMPAFGQIYNYESGNQHGGFPYLWRTSGVTLPSGYTSRSGTSSWAMIDAHTGNMVTILANVTSGGTAVYGKDGSILRFNLVNLGTTASPNYYLQLWNSSAIPSLLAGETGTNYWQWRPMARVVHDGDTGFSLNVSIPSVLGPRNSLLNETASIQAVREGDYMIVGTAGRNDDRGIVPGWLMGISLETGKEGTKLWEGTFTPPFAGKSETVQLSQFAPEDGMFFFSCAETLIRYGYSLDTFKLVWTSEPEVGLNFYSMKWPNMGPSQVIYQGKLISCGYGGVLTAYDAKTGEVVWTFEPTTEGFESSYGGRYPSSIGAVADGKLYIGTGEHSPTQPLYRGRVMQCINASDGALIWNFPVFGAYLAGGNSGTDLAIADGILLGLNGYDNQIYAFGRGPSATTVTASPKVSIHGNNVLIEGTVTDQTASGRHNINDNIDFTLKGTPAISDEDMSAWMEYMFQQRPKPTVAKGVEVTLEAIDPNGNLVLIGSTTSDINGNYGFAFVPEVPGTYQIFADFAGSKAYGSSDATTYLVVDKAAPTASPYPIVALPPTEMYIVAGVIAIIIAIAIGFAVTILILRKRP